MANTNKKIPVFKPKYRTKENLSILKEIFNSGWTGIGNKTIQFENEWKKFTGLKNAHFLNSGTSGLHISLLVLKKFYNWKNDSEIITTPISFVSTSHSILYSNLKAVFSDIDYTGTLDPKKILGVINKKTKAILFVGLGGSYGNLLKIKEICKKKKIKLIIDAAHMSGSYNGNKHIGSEGDVSIFSFQAVKNLPSADSGIICFKDKKLDAISRKISWCGIDKDTFAREKKNKINNAWEYDVLFLGYKYHGNSVIAAIASISLKYLTKDNLYRTKLSNHYIKNLKKNKRIFIVQHSKRSSRHLFSILVKNRKNLINALTKNNIYPGVHYKSILEFTYYKKIKNLKKAKDMSVSKKFSKEILSLPLHMYLTYKDVEKICKIINNHA